MAAVQHRTIAAGVAQDWQLTEVADGRRFDITGFTPDGAGALSFAWDFADAGSGTRLTQRIRAHGPDVEGSPRSWIALPEREASIGLAYR